MEEEDRCTFFSLTTDTLVRSFCPWGCFSDMEVGGREALGVRSPRDKGKLGGGTMREFSKPASDSFELPGCRGAVRGKPLNREFRTVQHGKLFRESDGPERLKPFCHRLTVPLTF